MDEQQLRDHVSASADALAVPGVAVGVYHQGAEHYAFHGITNVDAPVAVDESTLFQFGSTGKTFTATAMMRLVEQGDVDLDAPVRRYVPELKLKDESVADRVTVLQLFNHTAGWSGDLMENTGEGDDALARYVANMEHLEQVTPLGSTVSYNNASLSLAGLVIQKVTGKTYEQAVKEMLIEPLGLDNTFFFMNDIMTRRFATGHSQGPDGVVKVARPWGMARGGAPAGGISSNAADQIAWARFHLGDGTAPDGTRVLSEALLKRMQQPTVECPGSAIGDAVGISWLLRDVDGVRLVMHGGSMIGQFSAFVMVPERDFAVIVLTNSGPNGSQLHDDLVKWALGSYIGVVDADPEPIALGEAELAAYTGRYETIAAWVEVGAKEGALECVVTIKPEIIAQLRDTGEEVPDQPPVPIGLLAGEGDKYVVTDGPAKGMRGYFVRDASGAVEGVHMGGRLATRVAETVPA